MRPGAMPPPGQSTALDPLAVVRAAMAGEPVATEQPKRRMTGGEFSMTTVSPALRKLGILYAIYLCFAVLRVQEVITALSIPKLPMVMSLVIGSGLVLGVPAAGWRTLWTGVAALRWQTLITILAVVTIPLGIWVGHSLELLYPSYAISIVVFLGGIVLLRDRAVLLRTLQIMGGTSALIAILVFMGIGAGSLGPEGRLTVGVSLDPNDYAWILATFVPITLWLGIRNKATALLWFGTAALLVIGIVKTQSRGGFVALLSGAVVLIFFGYSGWRRILLFAVIGILGVVALTYIDATGASRLTDFSSYEGGTGREDLWKQGIGWIIQRPWGYGMGNYTTYNVWMTREYLAAHSAFIGIGVELGVLGLTAFAAIWLGILRGLHRLRAAALKTGGDAASRESAVLYGFMLSALVANLVGSLFLNVQYAGLTLLIQSMGAALLFNGASSVESRTAMSARPTQHAPVAFRLRGAGAQPRRPQPTGR